MPMQDSVLSLAQISHGKGEKPQVNILMSSLVATLMVSVIVALIFALTQKGGYQSNQTAKEIVKEA